MNLPWFGDPFKDARKILGDDRVISPKEMKKALKARSVPKPSRCYSKERYEWCEEENAKGAQWSLFCRTDQSFVELRKQLPDEFCSSSIWQNPPSWMTTAVEPACRLINFNPKPFVLPALAEQGAKIDRAWLITLAQALLGFKLIHNKRFLEAAFHGGEEGGDVIPVLGAYSEHGMLIYTLPLECGAKLSEAGDLQTIVCCAPEVKPK